MAEETRHFKKAVDDISAHAKMVDADKLKGKIKVITKKDIRKIIQNIIDSYKGLSSKELLSKISEYELKVRELESRLDAASKNADAEKELAGLSNALEVAKANSSALEGRVEELEARLREMDGTLASAKEEVDAKNRRIAQLDSLAQGDSLTAKIAELQREMEEMERAYKEKIRTLEEYIRELEVALEFVDMPGEIVPADFTAMLDVAGKIAERTRGALSENPACDAEGALSGALDGLGVRIEGVLQGFSRAAALIKQMEEGKGTIAVVNEIDNIYARNTWALEDMEHASRILEALCTALSAG